MLKYKYTHPCHAYLKFPMKLFLKIAASCVTRAGIYALIVDEKCRDAFKN
jgi:hypothetical protein